MKAAWKSNLHPLILQVAAHDNCSEDALAELINQTSDNIKKLIHRIASDLSEYEIDSITNRVFTLVWLKGSSYSGKIEPGWDPDLKAAAWLEKIIRNECYTYLRGLKKDKNRETQEADIISDPAEEQDQSACSALDYLANRAASTDMERPIEEKLIQEEQNQAFQRTLSEEDNHILERRAAGYSSCEIAGELGISEPAVSQKRSKIKRKYEQFLEVYDKD